ncbi:putative Integrase family protein [Pseudodesulfovibrio profundus]|uniref:Putative Integrase family protein n=1 Tax=Pseudodesulfovibrio profundus TaxID=57320 RepID=A0A2C8FDQ9_9BACT|nr:tyrosine-type recombinase/integrase [Pseudodesulfovibrio profundus]SOB60595.1 putative Integrase family protein [Pseudodesulfovibrio profundus]
MMSLSLCTRPDRPGYFIRIDGKRHSLKRYVGRTVTDKREAERVFKEIKKQYLAGKLVELKGETSKTFGEFKDEYLEWARETKTHSSYDEDRVAFKKFSQMIGDSTRIDRVTLKHVDLFVAQCLKSGNKATTINKNIRHLRAAMGKVKEWGYMRQNPIASAKEIPTEKKPPTYIDGNRISKFLAGISDIDLRRMTAAYISTGRRRNELLNLDWSDVDLQRGEYLVRKAKGHLTRWYPINAAFRAVLESIGPQNNGWVFHRWRSPHTISRYTKRELRAAGLGHLKLHSLRHTFATQFIEKGGNLRVLQDLMGHTDYTTTEIYAHVADSHLKEEADRVKLGPIDLFAAK